MRTEEERRRDEQKRERMRRLNEAVDQAVRELPLAGTTIHCPKCRFDHLTYRYAERTWSGRFTRVKSHWMNPYPERWLIVRTCPQCAAETYERPADTVTDYED